MLCVVEVLKIKMVEVATCQLLLFELNLAGLKLLINSYVNCDKKRWWGLRVGTSARKETPCKLQLQKMKQMQLHSTATNKKQKEKDTCIVWGQSHISVDMQNPCRLYVAFSFHSSYFYRKETILTLGSIWAGINMECQLARLLSYWRHHLTKYWV